MTLPLAEVPPVKTAVTDSLGYMGHFYIWLIIKVGDGAGDFQYAAVGTGGEIQTYHRHLEHGVGLLIENTVLTQHLVGHLCVAVYARDILISCRLYLTGCQHSFPYFRGRLARFCRRQFAVLDICHLHLQIYSIDKNVVRRMCPSLHCLIFKILILSCTPYYMIIFNNTLVYILSIVSLNILRLRVFYRKLPLHFQYHEALMGNIHKKQESLDI